MKKQYKKTNLEKYLSLFKILNGARCRTRTYDLTVNSRALYRLS